MDSIARVTFEEFHSGESVPLLNYVFFGKNSSAIPARYNTRTTNDTASFNETNLPKDKLTTYHNILDIVGSRLQRNPKATITLTGCTSDKDEDNAANLAKARAQAVKDYLIKTWAIAPARIHTIGRLLPQNPTMTDVEQGREENRRVEITSNDEAITQPVSTEEIERVANPPSITFFTSDSSGAGIARWDISAHNKKGELFHSSGTGAPPATVQWNWQTPTGGLPTDQSQIAYQLRVVDNTGQDALSATKNIDVVQKTIKYKKENRIADTVYNKFALTLFDYDKATISKPNERIIQNAIKDIKPESHVTVLGYSDSLGSIDRNVQLASDRAKNAGAVIAKYTTPATLVAQGMGVHELEPSDTPEGRFYSRTVEIEVATPVQQ